MNSTIKSVHARQLIDCKCRPLVEVDVITEDGSLGRGAAPTGSSVGMYESCVLRDGDPSEYHGLSVHQAVRHVNEDIAPHLIGLDARDQKKIDQIMIDLDGTPNKSRLGGNAIYSTSIAVLRAAAESAKVPLFHYLAEGNIKTVPIPSFNVINGGNNFGIRQAFNEFIVMPYKASDIEKAVEIAVDVFQKLPDVIRRYTGKEPNVGGSYGWTAPSEDPEECVKLILEAIERCGYTSECALAFDCAISDMYDSATHTYYLNGRQRTSEEMIDFMKYLTEKYPFVFVEDMLDENDWDGYEAAHKAIHKTLIVADDFTVTNKERIQRAVASDSIDGFILKPNQVGTISEALDAYDFGMEHKLFAIPSGRSGGVIGDVVMDLAVGLQVPFIKNGCPKSGERIDKLNYLMRVKDMYPGCHMADISDRGKF